MANYSSNLKSWGAQGTVYPDNYSYISGEQPVDAWDNFWKSEVYSDIQHLISLTNERLETGSGSSLPSTDTAEVGEVFYDESSPALSFFDASASKWRRLLKADGDTMSGPLDMGGYEIRDSSGELTLGQYAYLKGGLQVKNNKVLKLKGAYPENGWFNKQEGGTVPDGGLVVLGQFRLDKDQSLMVTQANLSKDGFKTPAPSGIDLVVATDPDAASPEEVILAGDGTTLYDHIESGYASSVVRYDNTTGSKQTVVIALDNGHYNGGAGNEEQAFGGYIARVVD